MDLWNLIRARYYSPNIGRFLQTDPITWGPNDPRTFIVSSLINRTILSYPNMLIGNKFHHIDKTSFYKKIFSNQINSISQNNPQLFHSYLYCVNNPLIFVDPLGYFIAGWADMLVGTGLIGVGVGIIVYTGFTPVGLIAGGAFIVAGSYFLVVNPINESTVQKPLENKAKESAEKWFEDLDEFDKEEGRCLK